MAPVRCPPGLASAGRATFRSEKTCVCPSFRRSLEANTTRPATAPAAEADCCSWSLSTSFSSSSSTCKTTVRCGWERLWWRAGLPSSSGTTEVGRCRRRSWVAANPAPDACSSNASARPATCRQSTVACRGTLSASRFRDDTLHEYLADSCGASCRPGTSSVDRCGGEGCQCTLSADGYIDGMLFKDTVV